MIGVWVGGRGMHYSTSVPTSIAPQTCVFEQLSGRVLASCPVDEWVSSWSLVFSHAIFHILLDSCLNVIT